MKVMWNGQCISNALEANPDIRNSADPMADAIKLDIPKALPPPGFEACKPTILS